MSFGSHGAEANSRLYLPYFKNSAGDLPSGKTGSTSTAPCPLKKSLSSILDGLSAMLHIVGTREYHDVQSLLKSHAEHCSAIFKDASTGLYALIRAILALSLSKKKRARLPDKCLAQVNLATKIGKISAWPMTCFWPSLVRHS